MSILPAAIMGGSNLIGGIIANEATRKSSARQMDFQREMSDTAHQREALDLQKAGLNRILSVSKGGSGASTPSGTSYEAKDTVGPSINSAMSVIRTVAEAATSAASAAKILAERDTELENKNLVFAKTQTEDMNETTARQLGKKYDAERALIGQQTDKAVYENRVNRALWENPDMAKLIRSNFKLENAIKNADKEIAVREAERMKIFGKWDATQEGKVLLFLERLFGSILRGRR